MTEGEVSQVTSKITIQTCYLNEGVNTTVQLIGMCNGNFVAESAAIITVHFCRWPLQVSLPQGAMLAHVFTLANILLH